MLDDKQVSISALGRDLNAQSNIPGASPIATQAELARSQRVLKKAMAQLIGSREQGVGSRGDGETGRRGDGETGRRGAGEQGRRGDGETGRQGDGETGRRGDWEQFVFRREDN
jgi:hypothetical protein